MLLDDDALTRLVTSALDDVEAPSDGPARILAARGRPLSATEAAVAAPGAGGAGDWDGGSPASPPPRRWLLGVGAVAALAVVVALVGGSLALSRGSGSSSSSSASQPHAMSLPSVGSSAPDRGAGAPAAGEGPIARAPVASGGASSDVPAPPSSTRVVQTGSLTLTVPRGRVDATVGSLGDIAASLGGSVTRSQTNPDGAGTSADLTLQVPAGAFARLVEQVERAGQPSAVSTSATDVTSSYVDLGARIAALEATRQQFLGILAKAETISDILAVEAQVTPLQSQIEQLQGQQQVLDQQTSTASLSVHIVEQAPAAVPAQPGRSGLDRAWLHAVHRFASGMDGVVAALGGIAVFVVCAAALCAVARLAWAIARRRLV